MEMYHRELLVAALSCQERRRRSLSSVLKEKDFGLECEERDCPGQRQESGMSTVYPRSLKYICWPGAKALVGQRQEDICGDDVSSDLPIREWCGDV